MIFHKSQKEKSQSSLAEFPEAFTFLESVVAISLIGLGIATAVGAMTKINSFASMERNSTGAYAAVMTQIDQIQSYKPFSPLHRDENGVAEPQIPPDLVLGTRVEQAIPIYKDPVSGVVVSGTRTTTVTDVTPALYNGSKIIVYRAVVTVTYKYLDRPGKAPYSFSMTTLRAADE